MVVDSVSKGSRRTGSLIKVAAKGPSVTCRWVENGKIKKDTFDPDTLVAVN
jgi:hypothetical protein